MSERTLAGGRYVLSEPPIGAGGMGTVWKAFDTVLHREVAVKELRIPDGLSSAERDKLRARAMREARAAAGLDHPGIVTIHDVVDEGGRPWIVMRLLSGRSLDQAVHAAGPLSPRRTAELGVRLLEALAAAHANGVLHRDVKPQNVMLGGDGRWMLTDFGIASVAGATRTLTGTGIVTGTLGYIAPERLSGADPGPAADLWALGATLYYAVEGQHAHDHDDLPALIAAVLTRDPHPPKHAGPLAPVIAGLMERDPARRLDAETAREQLLAIVTGYPTFEKLTVPLAGTDKPTEQYSGSTKPLPGGTRVDEAAQPRSFVAGHRVLRTLAWQLLALNGAMGALLALIVYSLTDGMPVWIAGALGAAIGLGAGLGAALAPHLARWIGLPAGLAGSALLTGESLVATGVVVEPRSPVPAVVLAGIALVTFAVWHRLSRSLRQRIVPPGMLRKVTWVYRVTGFAGILLGAAVAAGCFWMVARLDLFDGNYIITLLVGAGVVVIVAALLGLPTGRVASATEVSEPPKRWVPVATTSAALVIPVLVGVQATVHYVEGLDDFTAVPNICASDELSQDRIAEFITSPPEPDPYATSTYVRCTWERIGGAHGEAAELEINLDKYGDSRVAARILQTSKERAERDGKFAVPLQLGDEGIRRPYDGMINSEDTLGVAVEVRIENVVLEVEFDQAESLGSPDSEKVEALATELVREIESQKPNR